MAVMVRSLVLLLLWASIPTALVGCRAPYHTRQGALLGGLTGAGMGAAIGSVRGETGAGAAIGSAVGAAAGAALGNGVDRSEARFESEQRAAEAEAYAGASSIAAIVEMSAAGLSDGVIISHLGDRGLREQLGPGDLIAMKQEGVSDAVIKAAQSISGRPIHRSGPITPVVFNEPVVVPACPLPHQRFHFAGPGRPHGHVTWGVAFGD